MSKYNNTFSGKGPKTIIKGNNTHVTIDRGQVTVEPGSDTQVDGDTSQTTVKPGKYNVTINGKRVR